MTPPYNQIRTVQKTTIYPSDSDITGAMKRKKSIFLFKFAKKCVDLVDFIGYTNLA